MALDYNPYCYYSIYDFMKNGFNWRTIISLIIVVSSDIVLFYKK